MVVPETHKCAIMDLWRLVSSESSQDIKGLLEVRFATVTVSEWCIFVSDAVNPRYVGFGSRERFVNMPLPFAEPAVYPLNTL